MTQHDRTYAAEKFAAQTGERWRRYLERVGTRSNDFGTRLARARFVYLHRRAVSTHGLPLAAPCRPARSGSCPAAGMLVSGTRVQ